MEFKCSHCGEMNDLDLSEFNISELAELSNQPVEDSEEILALKEQNMEKPGIKSDY
jgi:hypothetical protein